MFGECLAREATLLHATSDEIETYLRQMGQRGFRTFSKLGKLQPFVEAMQTELGRTILNDFIARYDALLLRLPLPEVTADEKAEFRVLERYLEEYSKRIYEYNTRMSEIKKASA